MRTLLALAIAPLCSAPALANDWPLPEAQIVSVSGHCDPAKIKTGMTDLGGGAVAFGFDFLDRSLSATDQVVDLTYGGKRCRIEARVDVPEGYRLKIQSFGLEGYNRSQGQDETLLRATYKALHGADRKAFTDMSFKVTPKYPIGQGENTAKCIAETSRLGSAIGPWSADFDLRVIPAPPVPTECGETFYLVSELDLEADKLGGAGPANLAVFSQNQQLGGPGTGMKWGWSLEPCAPTGPWFQHDWNSYYTVNGQRINARIKFKNDVEATFTTSGFTGTLDVHEWSQQGLSGRWEAQGNGGNFWFQRSADGRSFTGTYDYDGSSQRGVWNSQP